MHKSSILLFRQYGLPLFAEGMKILEVGPDGPPSIYQKMVSVQNMIWETLDIEPSAKCTYSGCSDYDFPIPDNRFDIVFSGQVIEHVPRVWRWMTELARVTKVGGRVITVNPVSWPYHEAPIDCWRIYPEGMKALCEEAGLVVETSFWGSLENPGLRPFWASDKTPLLRYAIAGRSLEQQHIARQITARLFGWCGGRVEKAFDNITIARKSGGQKPAVNQNSTK
jgi:SAM-dependent methyltransferase